MKKIRQSTLVGFLLYTAFAIAQNDSIWQRDSLESYLNKSNDAYDLYKYKEAIEYASILVEKGKEYDQTDYEFLGYDILGAIYVETDDSLQGKRYSEKALELARKSGKDSLVAWGALNLGVLYSENKNTLDKAVRYFQESIAINKKLKDYDEVCLTYINLIWTYLDYNETDEAYKFLQKASALPQNKIDSLNKVYLDLLYGRYHLAKKNYQEAALKLEDIALFADKENNIDIALETYNNLAQLYKETSNLKEAFKNLEKYYDYKQKAYTLTKLKETEKARAKFELKQAQKDLEIARKEQKYAQELVSKTKSLNTLLYSAIGILLLLLFAVYLFIRTRKKYIESLKKKNIELDAAREKAEKLSKIKTKFLSTVSHELRTPLYGVIGISTLLKEDENLAAYSDDLNSLKFSADYLLSLINDVLLLSKMDANAITLSKTPYKLDALLNNIVYSFESTLKQNNNELHLTIDKKLPNSLIGDPVRLSQVLINLVGNAIKFTKNGNVWLDLRLSKIIDKKVYETTFIIKDDGPGIPLDEQKTIFNEFVQLDNDNHSYQGTGLGLTIVKKVLKLYNSKIHLKSAPDYGSEFSFTLNLIALKEDPTTENVLNGTLSSYNPLAPGEAKKVLIVDDNKINQKVTQKTLKKYNILSSLANDGAQAIEMCKTNHFDLILMDINMPKMNGMEAAKKIREFNKEVPIIALTAVELDENKTEILSSGVNDIVHKPYNLTKFLNTIVAYLFEEESKIPN
ncbi:response regulator [Maribacter sp. MMG018]|uniref:tetratricopeptide repeat-containing hybrid sensor histidine kinase/response regulator n=1 Tax=Maribacter sp. MMG018 TaxID=2822688 RepID=UPI001B37704A|nr:response regulator [Maribacter sp. MMG018]MBQ4914827.1 response regulator [Maribacter sp. MMG018]